LILIAVIFANCHYPGNLRAAQCVPLLPIDNPPCNEIPERAKKTLTDDCDKPSQTRIPIIDRG